MLPISLKNHFFLLDLTLKVHETKSKTDIKIPPIKLQSIIKPTFVPILVVIDHSEVKKKKGGGGKFQSCQKSKTRYRAIKF